MTPHSSLMGLGEAHLRPGQWLISRQERRGKRKQAPTLKVCVVKRYVALCHAFGRKAHTGTQCCRQSAQLPLRNQSNATALRTSGYTWTTDGEGLTKPRDMSERPLKWQVPARADQAQRYLTPGLLLSNGLIPLSHITDASVPAI